MGINKSVGGSFLHIPMMYHSGSDRSMCFPYILFVTECTF